MPKIHSLTHSEAGESHANEDVALVRPHLANAGVLPCTLVTAREVSEEKDMVNQVLIITGLLLLCAGIVPVAGQPARSALPKRVHHLRHTTRRLSQHRPAQNSQREAEVTALQSALSARQGRQDAFNGMYPGWKITFLRQYHTSNKSAHDDRRTEQNGL